MTPGRTRFLAVVGVACALVLLALLGGVTALAAEGRASIAGKGQAADRSLATAWVVVSTADSGPGTLRQAMLDAASGDTITFDPAVFPPGSPTSIILASALPPISVGNLTIDGSSAPIALLGHGLASGHGLHIVSDGNTVKGLGFVLFPESGIVITDGANNIIGGSNATPGTGCSGECNVISGNQGDGVRIEGSGSRSNTVSGNLIGLGADGTSALGNGGHGVTIYAGAQDNTVGGGSPAERNIISASGGSGVRLDHFGTSGNVVAGNYIGTDIFGTTAVGNAHPGVAIAGGATHNWIGGAASGEGNVISGNNHNGIQISGSGTMSNTVVGNYIGTGADGTGAVPNANFGIMISEASYSVVGGSSEAERNIITYNLWDGVHLTSYGTFQNYIQGNWIGVDADGTRDVAVAHVDHSPAYTIDLTVFVGTEARGVFKTTDGGVHWSEMNAGLGDLAIQALAVSPDFATDQTLFVGTPTGVYKSVDGGASWASAGPAEQAGPVYDLALSPDYASDQTLLMGAPLLWDPDLGYRVGGVWMSTDGGANWQMLAPAAGLPVTADASTATAQDGIPPILGGPWWPQMPPVSVGAQPAPPLCEAAGLAGIQQDEGHVDGYAVAFSPGFATDQTLFVGTRGSSHSLFKSTDGGVSWVPIDAGLDGSDVRHVSVSPDYASDQTLFAMNPEDGGAHPFRSTDGGTSWTELTAGLPTDDSQPLGFALSPGFATDDMVFASFGYATWGVRGFFRSSDRGDTWVEASPGIQNQRSVGVVAVSPDYTNDGELLLSARWNGLLASYDDGDNWAYANGDLTDPGNGGAGVSVMNWTNENFIGGEGPGEGNLISNNGAEGIVVQGPNKVTEVSGNYIGTDPTGASSLGNAGAGVVIRGGSSENTVGGYSALLSTDCSEPCNLISGNGDAGILVENPGGEYNTISGNFVGTDATGSYAIPNLGEGVALEGGSSGVDIRNNLVSGNVDSGIAVLDGSSSITITGNYVGVDASGTFSIPNDYCGVLLGEGATHNTIGGDTAGERNVISGNAVDGIGLWSGDAGRNTIQGNYIGVDASGSNPIGNGLRGIAIMSGENIVGGQNASPGGTCSGECNLISGNYYGLQLFQGSAVSNTITGNYIGTDASGLSLLPHRYEAVFLGSYAAHNRLGGAAPEERNLIAGMVQIGPDFAAPFDNEVSGNYIGLDATGTTCLAQPYHGIALGGRDSVIGGDTAAHGNRICGAEHHGISISNGGNLVAHNEVYGHGEDGIRVSGPAALSNTLTRNSIYDNGGLGIHLVDGGNMELPAPIILSYNLATGTASGTACANCTIELFSDGHGEGRWFEASTMASAGGEWSISKGTSFAGLEVSATATDPAGNTSEFGQDWPPGPPAPPSIIFPICGVTNQPDPVFIGRAQMASTVRVGAEGLALGQTATDDRNRWRLDPEEFLSNGAHVITATASTNWGTSEAETLNLTVDSSLCFDPVRVTFAQLERTQHPRNSAGCVSPGDDLDIDLWPDEPVTVKVPARVATATVYIEVNSVRYDLYDPDGDKTFTGSFTPPSVGDVVILVVADCHDGPPLDTMQIGCIIDPDGYVYDGPIAASTGVTETIEGVTVTLYFSDTVRYKWLTWDAELYEQTNPQVTGPDGYFSFFTPPGDYRLLADGHALGYATYKSPVLTVVSEPIRYNVALWPSQYVYLPVALRNR